MRFAVSLLGFCCLLSFAGAQWCEGAAETMNDERGSMAKTGTVPRVLALRGTVPAFAPDVSQAAPTPARAFFVQMSQAERKNSCISVEFESSDSEAISLGRQVERLWNGGQYDDALAQLGNLEARVGHVAIGNSWRKPVPTREHSLWGGDARIGNRDSLVGLAFDSDFFHQFSNILAVLLHSHGPVSYSVCMSADSGATWAETFTWVGSQVTSLDAVSVFTHFFVAYCSPGENPQQVRLRQFLSTDGSPDEFSNGSAWVAPCTLDVGDTAKEVSIFSDQSTELYLSTLVSDGSVLLSWTHQDGVPWVKLATGITSGASRGLSATYNYRGSGLSWDLLSYLDATDTLRICVRRSSGFAQCLAHYCGSGELTSISASGDHVICAYEDETSAPPRVGYAVSYDGGDTWTTGTLSDTSIGAHAPEVIAPYMYGPKFDAVFPQDTPAPELRFRSGTPWSDPISIAHHEPYRSRPRVRRLGVYFMERFAVAYLSDTTPVVRGAYFTRSDWSGLAEQRLPQTSIRASLATVVRGVLFLPKMGTVPSGTVPTFGPTLLDISGRKVLDLHPGVNDVRALAPGVYFVVTSSPSSSPPEGERVGVRGRQASSVTKVVVTK